MPIYELKCPECDKVFEKLFSGKEAERFLNPKATQWVECPHCFHKNKKFERIYHGNQTGLIFKGKWYKTGGY